MNPLMVIEPWELPPHFLGPFAAPADFVFDTHWPRLNERGRFYDETDVLVRRVMHKELAFLFFHSVSRPEDGNWSMIYPVNDLPRFWNDDDAVTRFVHNPATEFWISLSRSIYFNGESYGASSGLYRFRIPSDHRRYCTIQHLAHIHSGLTQQNFWVHNPSEPLYSPFKEPIPFLDATFVKEIVFSVLEDEKSEARFALDWLSLTVEQRQQKALRFERSDASEMMLRVVLQSQQGSWKENEPVRWMTYDWKE